MSPTLLAFVMIGIAAVALAIAFTVWLCALLIFECTQEHHGDRQAAIDYLIDVRDGAYPPMRWLIRGYAFLSPSLSSRLNRDLLRRP